MDGARVTTYTDQDDGTAVSLSPSAAFVVRLAENPTTGYRWRLVAWDRAILELIRDEYLAPDPVRPGAGGEHIWEFVARAAGDCELRLAYGRGWEAAAPARTFSLQVVVR